MPKAENTPGARGMMTRRMPSSRAIVVGVQRSGAAISDQREIADIETALGGDGLHRVGHRGRRRCAGCRPLLASRPCRAARRHVSSARFGRCGIELHLAAEEAIGAEAAEREIGIGHRRLGAAEAVAGRARAKRRRFAGRRAACRPRPARSSRRRCRPRKYPSSRSGSAAPCCSRRAAPRRWSAPRPDG